LTSWLRETAKIQLRSFSFRHPVLIDKVIGDGDELSIVGSQILEGHLGVLLSSLEKSFEIGYRVQFVAGEMRIEPPNFADEVVPCDIIGGVCLDCR
jgi:hypothetical protein